MSLSVNKPVVILAGAALNLVDQLLNPSRKQWDVQLGKGSRKTRVQRYELGARETSECRPQPKWGIS